MLNHKLSQTSHKNNNFFIKAYKKDKNKSKICKKSNIVKSPIKPYCNDNEATPEEIEAEMKRTKRIMEQKRTSKRLNFLSASEITLKTLKVFLINQERSKQ